MTTRDTTAPTNPSPVEVAGAVLDVARAGDPTGPPVVFVHGALVDHTLWTDVAARLAAAGHDVHLPTWPLGSHRRPVPGSVDLSPEGVADLVAAYLDHENLTDATVVANDSGGAITQFLLTRRPERVGRVVFTNCDTFERFPPFPFDRLFAVARRPALGRLLLLPTRWTPVRHAVGFGPLVSTPLDAERTRRWIEPYLTDPGVREDLARFCRGVDPGALAANASRLGGFERPVLMAWGADDRYFRLADGRRLAACFPDAEVVPIEGARTFVALDRPDRVTDLIAGFVRRYGRRP